MVTVLFFISIPVPLKYEVTAIYGTDHGQAVFFV